MHDPLPEAFELLGGGCITEDDFPDLVFARAADVGHAGSPLFGRDPRGPESGGGAGWRYGERTAA